MNAQTFMNSRRKFLERSAMGAGGLLFSSMLLASCTDHDIPDPQNPEFPLLFDEQFDWNDDSKIAVTSVIEMVPVAGDILGGLVEIFWPSTKEDVWAEVVEKVQAMVNQAVQDTVFDGVRADLGKYDEDDPTGLCGGILDFHQELKFGNATSIQDQWITTKGLFVAAEDHFKIPAYATQLLPFFAQFANMYLGLLRDAVIAGKSWGRTDGDHQQDITNLQNAITSFYKYTMDTYFAGRNTLIQKTKADSQTMEPFKTVNAYDRQMSQTVLYFADIWAFYDVTQYPNGVDASGIYRREIYSDPFGSANYSGDIVITTPIPTNLPNNVTVWGYDRIDAVQLTYPAGSGPGGVTTTPRMGDASGGTNQLPKGGSFNLSPTNPITQCKVSTAMYLPSGLPYGPILNQLGFYFADGTSTGFMGGTTGVWNGQMTTTSVSYPAQAVSSIHINGVDKQIGSADCIVFGFQSWTPPAAKLNAIRGIYVTSPKERSAADFAKEFPKFAIPVDLITNELKAARTAYWDRIKARAK